MCLAVQSVWASDALVAQEWRLEAGVRKAWRFPMRCAIATTRVHRGIFFFWWFLKYMSSALRSHGRAMFLRRAICADASVAWSVEPPPSKREVVGSNAAGGFPLSWRSAPTTMSSVSAVPHGAGGALAM